MAPWPRETLWVGLAGHRPVTLHLIEGQILSNEWGPPQGLASDSEGKTKRLVLGNSVDFAEPLTDDLLVTVCSKIGSFSRFQAGKPKPPRRDARTVRPRESFRRITKVSRVRTQ